jgi:hypothetical protein
MAVCAIELTFVPPRRPGPTPSMPPLPFAGALESGNAPATVGIAAPEHAFVSSQCRDQNTALCSQIVSSV